MGHGVLSVGGDDVRAFAIAEHDFRVLYATENQLHVVVGKTVAALVAIFTKHVPRLGVHGGGVDPPHLDIIRSISVCIA